MGIKISSSTRDGSTLHWVVQIGQYDSIWCIGSDHGTIGAMWVPTSSLFSPSAVFRWNRYSPWARNLKEKSLNETVQFLFCGNYIYVDLQQEIENKTIKNNISLQLNWYQQNCLTNPIRESETRIPILGYMTITCLKF